MKCLRINNGEEYIGKFEDYCKTNEIICEKVPPKTPYMNGLAEMMNITIVDKVRSMFSHCKIPNLFWGEAIRTAIDLINLSPLINLNGEIVEKVWVGKKTSYSH